MLMVAPETMRGHEAIGSLNEDDLEKIKARALEISAEIERKHGRFSAEIIPDVEPAWHIVTTFGGDESKATNWLAERGFGVFVPRFADGSVLRVPVPLESRTPWSRSAFETFELGNRLIFPRRVFVFVWDVLMHWRRIRDCPGVQGIMVDTAERPIAVPDLDINRIQAMQYSLVPAQKPKRGRYSRSSNRESAVLSITARSYWAVDGEARNRLLDRALGLAS